MIWMAIVLGQVHDTSVLFDDNCTLQMSVVVRPKETVTRILANAFAMQDSLGMIVHSEESVMVRQTEGCI